MNLPCPPDNCPSCLHPQVFPFQASWNGNEARGHYRCPACGHCWATGWLLSALGGAA